MPSQVLSTVEQNFTKGLLTEFTGLNFPENAATSASNTEFTLIGDTVRREGIDFETNYSTRTVTVAGSAVASYKWNNAGGDGETQIIVEQVGSNLYFYHASNSTVASPLSTTYITSISISGFVASGGTFDPTVECQFSDGNGYLFVYRPDCDPFYCTYAAGTITSNVIIVQIRDFAGVPEPGVPNNLRPLTLSQEHLYNLVNQGWTAGNPWSATSTTSVTFGTGAKTFTIQTGLTISNGQLVTVTATAATHQQGASTMSGTVTSYSGSTLVLSISSFVLSAGTINPGSSWTIVPVDLGPVNTWFADVGNYPSNADQWWYFKDNTDIFDPTTTLANTTIGTGQAPQGSMILNAFQQFRSSVSGVSGITDITTTVRPRTGTWFQGRVWYSGVDASAAASGDMPYTTWTENIYFSQIVEGTADFGHCYQQDDPTSENLFDELATDGGVLVIQGSGSIYKLFPIANGMIVFAANGIWFITGSQGIGFSANDYTVTKISAVQNIAGTSFVDVNGLPYFWNEEGIYMIASNQQGSLTVEPLTVGTILTFYNNIPTLSKRYVRGAYDPIGYTIQWVYRSTLEASISNRYTYDSILNFSTYNKAFFPYTVDTTLASINSIVYVNYPNSGITAPDPSFKYFSSDATQVSFADEHDPTFVDWSSQGGTNYKSTFTTGYKLHGQGQRRFQIPYIYVFSRLEGDPSYYYIQSVWDYANTGNSGRWSTNQYITIDKPDFDMWVNRIKLRGQGLVLQLQFTSVDGQPFDIMGWSAFETQNTGV